MASTPDPGRPRVRITSMPPGEAPEAVRRAWIGLELPLAGGGARTVHASGVLSGARGGFLRTLLGLASGRVHESQGYVVTVREAMAVLAAAAPEAEAWWRQNVPRMFEGERSFVFAASCGELVGAAPPAAAPQRAGRLDATSSTPKMLLWLAVLVAVDLAIPFGWRSGWLPAASPRLWMMLALSAALTLLVGLMLIARLRAIKQRALDAQR